MGGVLWLLMFICTVSVARDPQGCVTRMEYTQLEQRVHAIENKRVDTGKMAWRHERCRIDGVEVVVIQVVFSSGVAGGVSFAATLTTSGQLTGNATIVFDNVLLNTAGAYNSSNGVFTALFYGIHYFSATIRADSNTALTTGVVKNGLVVSRIASLATSGDGQGSVSITLNLDPGDRVWVRADQNASGQLRTQSGWNVFTGFQLNSVI
ncbi:complement C1q tumor necrosis factor-related protein 2-like [Haliotis cracherodii]|uniref:complement C1q tumor necrosis factor-related protein 2-like n=1 Tax=Haliotis cracherodii TaxID=6455 RepID=UPI0039EA1ED1